MPALLARGDRPLKINSAKPNSNSENVSATTKLDQTGNNWYVSITRAKPRLSSSLPTADVKSKRPKKTCKPTAIFDFISLDGINFSKQDKDSRHCCFLLRRAPDFRSQDRGDRICRHRFKPRQSACSKWSGRKKVYVGTGIRRGIVRPNENQGPCSPPRHARFKNDEASLFSRRQRGGLKKSMEKILGRQLQARPMQGA